MNRRHFIATLGSAAAWPLAARAQQSERMRRIGVLAGSAESTEVRARIAAFRLALQNLGWREDHNIRIDIRWLGSDPQRIQAETTDLIAGKPDVIVSGTSVAIAQILQMSAVPIVDAGITDPVSQGFVKSWRGRAATLPALPLMRSRSVVSGSRRSKSFGLGSAKRPSCTSRRQHLICPGSSVPSLPRVVLSGSRSRMSRFATSTSWTARLFGWGNSQTLVLSFRRHPSLIPIPSCWSPWRPNTAYRRSMRSAITSQPAA
jgi:hypothetical protein